MRHEFMDKINRSTARIVNCNPGTLDRLIAERVEIEDEIDDIENLLRDEALSDADVSEFSKKRKSASLKYRRAFTKVEQALERYAKKIKVRVSLAKRNLGKIANTKNRSGGYKYRQFAPGKRKDVDAAILSVERKLQKVLSENRDAPISSTGDLRDAIELLSQVEERIAGKMEGSSPGASETGATSTKKKSVKRKDRPGIERARKEIQRLKSIFYKEDYPQGMNDPNAFMAGQEVALSKEGGAFATILRADYAPGSRPGKDMPRSLRVRVRDLDNNTSRDISTSLEGVVPYPIAVAQSRIFTLNEKEKKGTTEGIDVQRALEAMQDVRSQYSESAQNLDISSFEQAMKALASLGNQIRSSESMAGKDGPGADFYKARQKDLAKLEKDVTPRVRAGFTDSERRKFIRLLRSLSDYIRKKSRVNNPCIGLHFHGKDADEILQALENSSSRTRVAKKNPTKNAAPPNKDVVTWDHRGLTQSMELEGLAEAIVDTGLDALSEGKGIDQAHKEMRDLAEYWGYPEFAEKIISREIVKVTNPRAGKAAKKKTSKKKVTRAKCPPAATLVKKCQKLWESYCERPSKTRLKPIFEHLELMKQSKAKSCKEERARCLRAANKEAKRLGMK